MDAHLVSVLSNIGMISFIALSAYLLLLVGEISFGQQAFFAISAYTSGIATAMWGWDLWLGLLWGAGIAAISAAVIGLPTLRLTGLYFSIATLAFAELVRHVLLIVRYQVAVGGDVIGPDGANGFRDIRYIYDHDISSVEYLGLIYLLLAAAVVTILVAERSRLGSMLRMVGEDAMLSEMQGLDVRRIKIGVSAAAGFLAGIGGGFYAHFTSYVEPNIFGVMLGVHSLAYALIGGLGTVLGPLIGVAIDIGFLESIRAVSGYRMIIFGGLVAGLLIIRPRGLLDEVAVHRLRSLGRRRRAEA